jgi:hypothetical protein
VFPQVFQVTDVMQVEKGVKRRSFGVVYLADVARQINKIYQGLSG